MIVTNGSHGSVAFVLLVGDLDLADVDKMRAFYMDMHAKKQRFATVIDARYVRLPPSTVRRALADMSNEFTGPAFDAAVGAATVIDSPVMVGALQAVRWFLRTDTELQYFATPRKALAWCDERLRAYGAAVTPGAVAFTAKLESAAQSDLGSFAG